MKALTLSILAMVMTLGVAAPSTAQTQPATFPPAAPKPPTPVVFPVDAKYAVVDAQAVAATSVIGKEASKKLSDLQSKMAAGIQDKNKQLQTLQARRDAGGSVLNDGARAQLDKDIDKLQREIQYASSSAQADLQTLNNELMADFSKKVGAAVQEIAKEKGLYIVFTANSGVAYIAPEIDISDEVIKRLDAKKN